MKQLIPAHSRIFEHAAWGLVLLALIHLCLLQLRTGSEVRQVFADKTKDGSGPRLAERCRECDRMADKAGIDNRSILLRFTDFTSTNSLDDQLVSFIYFRTSYALYPRRAHVADDNQVINGGGDILRSKFNPDKRWLEEHNVGSVLTFDKGNSNTGTTGLKMHLEVLKPGDAGTASHTNTLGGNR